MVMYGGAMTWYRSGLLLILVLISGTPRIFADDGSDLSKLRAEVERLKTEVAGVRGLVEEYGERMNRVQQLYGMERYRFPDTIKLFGQSMPLHRNDVRERMDREFLLSVDDVPQVLLWMKRANRYFPFIERLLRDKELPEDLKYVAIVESALLPKISSYAGAAGLWQFMHTTGSSYDLRRTRYVDERRDPLKSTEAAVAHLRDLYDTFGDWFLAVAAYNTGEERIKKELERQKVDNYFDLVIPVETERYIFRIASAKIILSNPQNYGYYLETEELYQPINSLAVHALVKCARLDLVALAEACGMTYRDFMSLNPHFLASSISRGEYTFYVPPGAYEHALEYINDCDLPGHATKTVHRVRRGETLSDIAEQYGVSLESIQEWNSLRNYNRIYPGQRIIIYQ